MLASAVKNRVSALQYGITPKGSRPPFTRKMTPAETLKWWLQHRYDQLGLAIVQTWTPVQVAQLDAWLAQAVNHPAVQGQGGVPTMPQQGPVGRIPGVQNVLTRALGQERRIEGPPIGPTVA